MAYPVGTPYGLNNFNDLYAMLGVWAGQNKTNTDLFNMYKQYMQNPQSAEQSPVKNNNNKPVEHNKEQQPAAETQTDASVREEQALLAQQQAYLQQLAQQQAAAQTTVRQSQEQEQKAAPPQAPELDADDGKISWKRKLKNFGKGMLNMAKGLFCDEEGFSIKRTLTTVAVAGAAAALTVATGGAAAPFLVAAGAAIGAVQTGKGIYKAVKAETDAEAEAAWQDIGAGTLSIGLSAAGAKGALGAAGKAVPEGSTVTGAVKATADCFKTVKDGVQTLVTSPKETLAPLANSETWSVAAGNVASAAKNTFSPKSAPKTTKEALGKAYDKDISKLNKNADKLAKEISELQAKPQTDALKAEIQQKTARLEKIYRDINKIKAQKADIGKTTSENGLVYTGNNRYINAQKAAAEARKAAVDGLKNEIKDLKSAKKNAESPARKAVYDRQLAAAKRKLAEMKKLSKVHEQLDAIKTAEAKNVKLKEALKKVEKKIDDVKKGNLPEAQKSIELAKLNRHKSNVEKLIINNNASAARARAGLFNTNLINSYKNMPAYEKALTAGITGGINSNSNAENTAIDEYQQALEEYNQALLEEQLAYEEQLAQQQAAAEAQAAAQTQTQTQTQTQAAPAGQNTQAGQTPSAQTQAASEANNMNDIYKKYYDRLEALKTEAMSDFNKIVLSPGPGIV